MRRRAAPDARPVALTVAGSDSGGGAGIQADLKTMTACGVFGTSAITSVTAQNTRGVEGSHLLPTTEIEAQIDAVLDDFDVMAVKTGMLATADVIETVCEYAPDLPNLVVDPVMVATSGDRLLEPDAEAAYEDLLAHATLVTPNADEAAVLTGIEQESEADMRAAGEELVETGATAALIKGGHVSEAGTDAAGGEDEVVDVLVTAERVETFRHPRVDTDATHGSGCTLSSAIAAHLARDADLQSAVAAGVDLLARAVRYPLDVGQGPGSVHHAVELRDRAARDPTAERVAEAVERLVARDVSPLVPAVGMNVAGATPYAERPDEVAAVEGKITRTRSGVSPNRGVRFGVSSRVADRLVAVREADPDRRFAVNCRYDDAVAAALSELDGSVAETDDSRQRAVREAVERPDGRPIAVVNPGGEGVVPTATLLADDADRLVERTVSVLETIERDR
ncbi:bifunctional hydroxymethylpyrimidine kinase/phosphomethylpyrimidine kinase [Halorientalis halophila]|uniref:bifunctional hydroxymethylpyrimidine kinase/phosphomethylpyrimidine kinase n=1 Tax=Halorientalis halophila TaxID=3108499 RepID=UPI00300AB8A9